MTRVLLACLFMSIGGVLCAATTPAPQQDFGARLLREKSKSVFALTPPSTNNHGGTGFAVVTPLGRVLTLTNAHVCAIAEEGALVAHPNDSDRGQRIRVLEVSTTADLCVLEGVAGASGIALADTVGHYELLGALGHPLLHPITFSSGYIVSRDTVAIAEADVPADKCVGRGRAMEHFETIFGTVDVCIAHEDAYNTSIESYPGNSGSPIFNQSGDCVGVLFAGDSIMHHAFIVPLDNIKDFLKPY